MAVFRIPAAPEFLSASSPHASEVIRVFENLFLETRPSLLPPRAVVMPYTGEARYSDLRDSTRQSNLDGDPRRADTDFVGDHGRTYGEVFLDDIREINEKLPTREQSLIVDAVPPETAGAALASLPRRMWHYAHWIRADLILLLQKRLALGPKEGLLEDLFRTYSAGYFAFGWSGTFPQAVRLLVFRGRESDERRPMWAS